MLQPGDTLNNGAYRVAGELGAGGFGVVFLADEVNLGRRVAIKTILPEIAARDRNAAAGFYNEARMNAGLDHPHIIPIYYIGQEPVRGAVLHYIVMEFVEGGDLESALAAETVPLSQRLRWMRQIADGLAYAHQQGVIHRDLKLRNVFLARSQNVKIGDFGLAKAMGSETKTIMKGLGTPAYVAPEQIQGRSTTARTDIYSLGVMYYQMLTGRLPYDAPDAEDSNAKIMAICYQHVNAPIPSARALNRQVPPELDRLIQRMMAKAPEARPESALEVRQVLETIVLAEPEGERQFDPRWIAVPAAVLLLTGGGYGAYVLWAKWTAKPTTVAQPTPPPVAPPTKTEPPRTQVPAPAKPAAVAVTPVAPPTPSRPAPPPATVSVPSPQPTPPKPTVSAPSPQATSAPATVSVPSPQPAPTKVTPPPREPSPPIITARPAPSPAPVPATPPKPAPGEVKTKIEEEFRRARLDVSVDVSATGIVTLTGVVDEQAQRDRALSLASRSPGVVAVKSNINVRGEWR